MDKKFVVWLDEIDKEDIDLVGGKGANLGEMTRIGIPVPTAFIITSIAYFYFLEKNNLKPKIKNYLKSLDISDPNSLKDVSTNIQKLILSYKVPLEVAKEILKAYSKMSGFLRPALVAVRSSATAEDLPTASFAGQQETFLNIQGEVTLIEKVRACWASLFTPRAIFYRQENKFDHFKVGIAIPVQKMVQSEASGVIFTVDPVSSNKKKIIIEAIYGLGELIVQGQTIPDHYEIDKETLKIISKSISYQDKMLVKKGPKNCLLEVPSKLRDRQKISDEEIIKLAYFSKKIERHYFFPQDIEWAIEKEKIYILQTRPITTLQKKDKKQETDEKLSFTKKLKPILIGIGASPGIVSGPIRIIKTIKEINKIKKGEILVAQMTNPDYVPAMKKAVGIITDAGGRTAHAAIVSRELGIPCVVGTKTATKLLKTGDVVTIDGAKGEVYRGGKVFDIKSKNEMETKKYNKPLIPSYFEIPPKTVTKVYVNLAEPERAREVAKLPVDGVGLLRAEFMIAQIGIHPKKIIKERKQKMFEERLSSNIAIFCDSFVPRPVVYRTSDFKTSEYRNLKGGDEFEPKEENPLIGYRGAYRYLTDPEVFELELNAIKKVRDEMKFRNLWMMIPFVRTPQELIEVKKIIASVGLLRSPSFKIWLMIEIPVNIILLEDFLKVGIDGVSIGSNDLTMLILGVDRNNEHLVNIFNERNSAVLWSIEKVIKTCKNYGVTSSICGQAVSDYPDLVSKLIEWGITSVSVNPDAVLRVKEVIFEAERRLCQK